VVDVAVGMVVVDSVVAEVGVSVTKVAGALVSTRTADLEGHQMALVGMVLRAAVTGVVVMDAAEEDWVHREVVVGMEVGTAPILNGRAQGWTRIATQSGQGIELIFSGAPSGSHHGVSLPECFLFLHFLSRSWPCSHFPDMLCKYPVSFLVAVRLGKLFPATKPT